MRRNRKEGGVVLLAQLLGLLVAFIGAEFNVAPRARSMAEIPSTIWISHGIKNEKA